MFKYEVKQIMDWGHAMELSRQGWKLVGAVRENRSIEMTVYYMRRRLPFLKIGRWVVFTLFLSLAFTACEKYAVTPDGQIPGYHIERLDKWLKSGFPLDTTMMYYQHPDPPVPMRQPIIDCLMHGPCKPQTFNIYIPDSIYFKYHP